MLRERSVAVLETLPETYVYPTIVVGLLLGTAVAFATDRHWLGVAGVLALSVVSLSYGAIQRPEEFRD